MHIKIRVESLRYRGNLGCISYGYQVTDILI
jgi:hypothetical protein